MKTKDYNEFMECYSLWLQDCRDQLTAKGYEDVDNIQINEDGSVYFGNLSVTAKSFVTPWEDSIHYVQ